MIEENFYKELVEIRHYLHAHPEISEQEVETTNFIRQKLSDWQIEIMESQLKTGLIAKIGSGEPVIALRADIDALPILEETGLEFSSENKGAMHACGHDLHMTSLLGAAKILKEGESRLKGTVKLIFQPAEEIGEGAKQILGSGLVSDVQAFVGYHNMPTLPAGVIGLREGGVMAAVERFKVLIKGQGSHAAYPQEGRDPILASAAIIQNLQQIVSRNISPLKSAVVSITHIEAGTTWNVLPNDACLEGTIRTFDNEVRSLTKRRFSEIIDSIAKAYDVEVEIDWLMEANLTFNDFELTDLIRKRTEQWHDQVIYPEPSSAGEDFANYQKQAPSIFAFIGSNKSGASGLHFADMTVRDEVIRVAVEYYVQSVQELLEYIK
ncbi:amidohydrolase [Lactococcus kimchii]|uniref:amidohydrolase n=1 Tax=Lactococcus sp. S-13 TaxID=2507158 RepID=UPI001022F9C0|nr:amidohydrolase [Lactococcus sp. S-13]RZI48383.1 amidohydrolase [Lactococcus sp. S-13]